MTEQWAETLSDSSIERRQQALHRRAKHFIAGPIPVPWVARAAAVNSTAALVGIALWFRVGCEKARTVKAGHSLWSRFNISRFKAQRGLRWLEAAGLIAVQRGRGCNPVVTILASPKVVPSGCHSIRTNAAPFAAGGRTEPT